MRTRSFLLFVGPSVAAMAALILLPLIFVGWLSVHESYIKTELVEVKTVIPLFPGVSRTETKIVPQPVLDEAGLPVQVWNFVGQANYAEVLQLPKLAAALGADRTGPGALGSLYHDIGAVEFWGALEFTLLYIVATTPLVLLFGFVLALAVDAAATWLKGVLIFASLLPFIITPVVGALSVYWLFLDRGVVNALFEALGFGKVYFLSSALPIRALIIAYGVWHVTPFAFVILYAGLQTVPQDSLEAAVVDGASRWQRVRLVIMPHLAPLFVFITLIHVMDAYRVFEPVLVFASNLYASSMQYMIWRVLNQEDNFNKAAAAAMLTVAGIVVLLLPVLRRFWLEHRSGQA